MLSLLRPLMRKPVPPYISSRKVNNTPGGSNCLADISSLAGALNKIFLWRFGNGSRLIARIPCRNAGPPHLTTSSEVATMDFARSVLSLPVPKVVVWSSRAAGNPVGSQYILMEVVKGTSFAEGWRKLSDRRLDTCLSEAIGVTECLSSTHLSQIGSIFYTEDVPQELRSLPLYADEDIASARTGSERFRVGPCMSDLFWRGRRTHLNVDRGPCESDVADVIYIWA